MPTGPMALSGGCEVASTGTRVSDLLSYLTTVLEINQKMSVHFDNGIGMGETRVENGKVEACVRKSG